MRFSAWSKRLAFIFWIRTFSHEVVPRRARLRNLLHSDDTQVMMAAVLELKGATFAWEDGGDTLVVTGGGVLTVDRHCQAQLPTHFRLGNITRSQATSTVSSLVTAFLCQFRPLLSAASAPNPPFPHHVLQDSLE